MAGRHLPRSWAGSPGSILVSAASAGASALTVIPVAASREARKWVSCVQPGLGRMMRAGDAAGERGGPEDEQDPAGPRFPHGARRALGEQQRGAQVHRQHLIELGGG